MQAGEEESVSEVAEVGEQMDGGERVEEEKDKEDRGREETASQGEKQRGSKRKVDVLGDEGTMSLLNDLLTAQEQEGQVVTLPGAASAFDPLLFLCQQSIETNGLLQQINQSMQDLKKSFDDLSSKLSAVHPGPSMACAVSSPNSTNTTTNSNHRNTNNSQSLTNTISAENFTLASNHSTNSEQFTVPLEYTIYSSTLQSIKEACTSPRNFCVKLLRILFSKEELIDSNLTGTKGNRMLDPVRIKVIFYYYDLYYPSNLPRETIEACKNAICIYCRSCKRNGKSKN